MAVFTGKSHKRESKRMPPELAKRHKLPPRLAKRQRFPKGIERCRLPTNLERILVENNIVLIQKARI